MAFAELVTRIVALGAAVPFYQVVFFRSAVALVPLIVFLCRCQDFLYGPATRGKLGHIALCMMGATAMFASVGTIRLAPPAAATMLLVERRFLSEPNRWITLGRKAALVKQRRTATTVLSVRCGEGFPMRAVA